MRISFKIRRWWGRCKWLAVRIAAWCNWYLNRRIPQPGDIVITGLDGFGCTLAHGRVNAWLCDFAPFKPDKNDFTECLIYDLLRKEGGPLPKREFCFPEFAQYVCTSGVCGHTLALRDCLVIGRVRWPEEHIREQYESALRFAYFRGTY